MRDHGYRARVRLTTTGWCADIVQTREHPGSMQFEGYECAWCRPLLKLKIARAVRSHRRTGYFTSRLERALVRRANAKRQERRWSA